MSRSIHQTFRKVFRGKSVREVVAMCNPADPDNDVAALLKKNRYKRASDRGKYKIKPQPDPDSNGE